MCHACLPSHCIKRHDDIDLQKDCDGDGSSTNKTSGATAYQVVGTAKNSCMSMLKKRNNARKMFLIPCWHCDYGSPEFMGVLSLRESFALYL